MSFDKLLLDVAFGKRDEDSLTSLASHLARLDRALKAEQHKQIAVLSSGATLGQLANQPLDAINPDQIVAQALTVNIHKGSMRPRLHPLTQNGYKPSRAQA